MIANLKKLTILEFGGIVQFIENYIHKHARKQQNYMT